MIRFRGVTKEFPNGTIALNKVDFQIDRGKFALIVGPSGAGKTTILRLILKQIEPSEGKIEIDNRNLEEIKKKHLPHYRRKIGAVFQDYKLITDRTISENIAIVSEIIKKDGEEIRKHVKQILEKVNLDKKADLFPSQLSGGELQRAAIARALATKPEIVFADEPTGNLDLATAWEIINLLLEINKSGATVIVATHNQSMVDSLNKRVIELKQGRVVKDTRNSDKSDKDERGSKKKAGQKKTKNSNSSQSIKPGESETEQNKTKKP